MGFWKNLFKRKRSKSSESNLKEETRITSNEDSELKEETRIISNEDSGIKIVPDNQSPSTGVYNVEVANNVLSAILYLAIEVGDIKRYSNIDKFIKAYPPLEGISYPSGLTIDIPKTKEIEKLANNWYMLSYKCNNIDLANLMLNHFR